MRRRNCELALLLIVALLLGGAAWYAGNQHIGRCAQLPNAMLGSTVSAAPVNLLLCTPDELLAVLSRRFADPGLTTVQASLLRWRKALSPDQEKGVVLSDLLRLRGASPSQPAHLFTAEEYRFLRPFWVVRDPDQARRSLFSYMGILFAPFLAAHLVFRFSRFSGGQVLLPLALLLCGVSTILLFTFTDPLRDRLLYQPFVVGVAAGCITLVLAARFVRLRVLEEFKYRIILAALAMSFLLIIFGTGPAGTDARINLFGFFQPVEFIKGLVVLFLAGYLAVKDVELRRLDGIRWMGLSIPRLRDILPVAVFVAATLALFFLQKDLGPALILYLVFLGIFVLISRRIVLGLTGLGLLLSAFWAAYQFRLLQTVATRIEMWLSPWDNHRPGGIQLAESLWALASGGFWGAGPGRGEPQYIPAGHTDLILAAGGEALGFPGFVAILAAFGLLFAVMVFYAWRARGAYACYLGFGLAFLFGIQTAVIAAGTLGLIPLTGVPVPFMSYGKSAVIAHLMLLGFMLNVSSLKEEREQSRLRIPYRVLSIPALVLVALAGIGWKAYLVMHEQADDILCRGALTPQLDGVRRFSYNRRILDLANRITRGTIRDRSGLPLATSRQEDIEKSSGTFDELGVDLSQRFVERRVYPLGPFAVQLLGHTRGYWTDPRTVEKTADLQLRGYANHSEVILVEQKRIVRQDYSELIPAFRERFSTSGGKLHELLNIDKDVTLTLDARFQVAAMRALENNMPEHEGVRRTKGAAVVLEASNGKILASVSLPTYDPNTLSEQDIDKVYGQESKAAYDRARYEIYPPGSTFKVVCAAAALEDGWMTKPEAVRTRACHHVDEVPWEYAGQHHLRRVTDDEVESAHGRIDLPRALVESCNIYFAWLGTHLGPEKLFEFARNRFHLELKGVRSYEGLEANLPDNAYGQAKITVSPLRMASVAATVANGGIWIEPVLFLRPAGEKSSRTRIISDSTATTLWNWMVQVVQAGTGRRAAVPNLVVGGKTGTAQNEIGDKNSHSWFIGFAYPKELAPERAIAFAFMIENGGYGGRAAAQAAHDFLQACFPEASPSKGGS